MPISFRPIAALGLLCLVLSIALPRQAKAALSGIECTIILDAASGRTLRREGACEQRVSPASTFKVALALIGYDAGILTDEHTPAWDYRPEYDAPTSNQKTVDPVIWERDSIVWFSRELTRRLGKDRFAGYVNKLGYGNQDVSGDPGRDNGLSQSWISSSLRISPDEQVVFLRRIFTHDLPVSDKAYAMTQAILPSFSSGDGWVVQGKTGSCWLGDRSDKLDKTRPLGWFIGWAQRNGQRIIFARLVVSTDKAQMPLGLKVREKFLGDLPGLMKE